MKVPKVSVIVPVYNTEAYLNECLNSIISQSLKDIEIICINDGSTDNSPNILRQYATEDSRFTIIDSEEGNMGPGFARNTGIKKATGEYIAFIDSDDYVHMDMLKELYNTALEEKVDVAICNITKFAEDPNLKFGKCKYDKYIPESLDTKSFNYMDLKDVLFDLRFTACNKIYRKSFLVESKIDFPEGTLYEDLVYTYKVLFSANSIRMVRKNFYYNRKLREGAITFLQGNHLSAFNAFEILEAFLNNNPDFHLMQEKYIAFKFKRLFKYLPRNDSAHIEKYYIKLKEYASNPLLDANPHLNDIDRNTISQIRNSDILGFLLTNYTQNKRETFRSKREINRPKRNCFASKLKKMQGMLKKMKYL